MRQILENILGSLAKRIAEQYRPVVVGITGSTGKTTTRRAIAAALSKHFRIYTPPRNLNDKLGLPLGIIGEDTAGRNLFGWFKIIVKAMRLLTSKSRYPEVLVLEYGIDRVGEMDELVSIVRPNVAVLTGIGLSHYEFFQDPEVVKNEKAKLLKAVMPQGTCIVNGENQGCLDAIKDLDKQVVLYGGAQGNIRLLDSSENLEKMQTSVKIQGQKDIYEFSAKGIGTPHVLAWLAAVAVAEFLGVRKDDVENGLSGYTPVPGRLNLLAALKKSWLIDDTYNAAPDSMISAIKLFERLPSSHKIAVLGDMLELGVLSDEEHRKIGIEVAKVAPNHLVTVGQQAKLIAKAATDSGLPEERVICFDNASSAAVAVHELVQEGSLILVKASQGIRLEKVSKELLAEPMKARELLVRQDERWLQKA